MNYTNFFLLLKNVKLHVARIVFPLGQHCSELKE